MSTVVGMVEAKSKTKFGYGILVNGKWHNSKFEIKCEKGDQVEFEDGGKNYCNKLKVVSSGGGAAPMPVTRGSFGGARGSFPIGPLDGQRSIIRQNAVTNANTFLGNFSEELRVDISTDTLLDIARQIEAYTTGDLDAEEAEAMLKEDHVSSVVSKLEDIA